MILESHEGHGLWDHLPRLGGHPPPGCLRGLPPPQHLSILAILFSIRHGDPLATLLFIIYQELFLVRLEANLYGFQIAHIRADSFDCMDDVEVLGSHLSDIESVDTVKLAFEAAAGALLNRKTLILGLGSWTGRLDWPLPWLQAATSIKVLGFDIHPILTASMEATRSPVLAGIM